MRHNLSILSMCAISVATSLLAGCSNDTSGPAPVVTSTLFFNLALNQHAINMSLDPPFNTIQLTATPLNADGRILTGAGHPNFRAADSSVTVDTAGLVTARYVTPAGGTQVIATLQQDNLTLSDTAWIQVTATAPTSRIETFSIQPTDGDSAVRGLGIFFPTVHATDSTGQLVSFQDNDSPGNNIYWIHSSSLTKAYPNEFSANDTWTTSELVDGFALNDTGHVTLYATSWVYGITVRDSLNFLIGWPISSQVAAFPSPKVTTGSAFNKRVGVPIFLSVGGTVLFVNNFGDSLDIIFDDSTAVDSAPDNDGNYSGRGNVHFSPSEVFAARRFLTAGTHKFWNQKYPSLPITVLVLVNPK